MDKITLNDTPGFKKLNITASDVKYLNCITHRLRQEIGDPRLPKYAAQNYAVIIDAIEDLIKGAEVTK